MVLVYFCSQHCEDGVGQGTEHVAVVVNLAQHFWVFQNPFCFQSLVLIMMYLGYMTEWY